MYFVTWLYESISPSMTYRQQRQVLNRIKRQRMNESDPNTFTPKSKGRDGIQVGRVERVCFRSFLKMPLTCLQIECVARLTIASPVVPLSQTFQILFCDAKAVVLNPARPFFAIQPDMNL